MDTLVLVDCSPLTAFECMEHEHQVHIWNLSADVPVCLLVPLAQRQQTEAERETLLIFNQDHIISLWLTVPSMMLTAYLLAKVSYIWCQSEDVVTLTFARLCCD